MTLKKIEPTDCGGTVELPLLHYITDGVRLLQRTFAGPLLDLCWTFAGLLKRLDTCPDTELLDRAFQQ